MALTRFLRQAQLSLDGMVTDREIFTGLSPSTLQVWSIQRVEIAPLVGGGIDVPALDDFKFIVFRIAEEPGTYGAAQGLENPKVLMHYVEMHRWQGAFIYGTPTDWSGPGHRYPYVWEAPKGLITHSPTLYVTSDSTYPAFGYWSMRIYYTLLNITQDDLIFLRSVR